MRKLHRFTWSVAIIVLALTLCVSAFGQVTKGSISGTVTDPQNAVVAGAQVKLTNTETGQVITTTTDSTGAFHFNLIPTGTYNVQVTQSGFKTTEVKNLVVGAGEDKGLGAMKLAVGGSAEVVDVTAEAALVESTQAQVTNAITGELLSYTAGLQGNRGVDQLALLVPGVNSSRSNNFSNTNGASISSNGLRGRNNDQQIDGQNNNDNSVAGPGLFLSNPEFLQQYVIVTNQFGPEYGRNSGSVVNLITKSGTNAWHGSVSGTENSNFLNALSNTQRRFTKKADNITPISGPPRFNDEVGSFTVGGPWIKNKLFFFGAFQEELIGQLGVFTGTSLVPTPAGLAQMLAACPNSNGLKAYQTYGPFAISAGNPQALSITTRNLTGLQTTANPGCSSSTLNNVQFATVQRSLPAPYHEFDFLPKLDWQSAHDTVTGRYVFNRGNTFLGTGTGSTGYIGNVPALSQAVTIGDTHNFTSHMVNEGRIAFSRLNVEFGGNNIGNTLPDAGQLTNALTRIDFSSTFSSIGPATNLPQARIVNTWQAQDNFNYVMGRHTFKAGVNWTYQRSPNIFLPNVNGRYRFSNFSALINDGCGSGCPGPISTNNGPNIITVANGPTSIDFREYDSFLYVGDDWKVGQSLTLNLGLTWSYYGQPANLFNQVTTARETGSGAFWNQSLPIGVRTNPQIDTYMKAFGPSIGFAYSPQWGGFLTGRGKTVFRGGYRMAYDPPFYNIYLNISTAAPFVFLQTFTNTTATNSTNLAMPANPLGPNVRAAMASFITPGVFDPRTQNQTDIPKDFGPDHVQSWSFGFERSLSRNAAFEARYTGNHATDQFQTINGNPFITKLATDFPQFTTGLTPCAATQEVGVGAGTDLGRVQCGLGVVRRRQNSAYSDYNALQLEFRANNLFKQLTMRTGYTWSKNTDNVSEIFATGSAGNTNAISQNPLSFTSAEHGLSGLDFPQNWYMNFTEQLPFFKEQKGVLGHVLGGWSFSGTYRLVSGQPWTPAQVGEAVNNYYDSAFWGAFIGIEPARPFAGSSSAPLTAVGMFCGDALSTALCTSAFPTSGANTLISLNAVNLCSTNPACTFNNATIAGMQVTQNDVRFIENTPLAQKIFGTPFGNVGRNTVRDAITNIANAAVYKKIKFTERTNFEMFVQAVNVLNHFNFSSVDPTLLDAGLQNQLKPVSGTGFGEPNMTSANGRSVLIGGRFTF
jgi:hypothetical protein